MLDVLVIKYRILANEPDILLHDKQREDLSTDQQSHTRLSNVHTEETEKLSKYKDPEIKVSMTWKVRTKTVPATIGALRTELQKIILMSTACIIRKVMG
jgi:hypothetical protein